MVLSSHGTSTVIQADTADIVTLPLCSVFTHEHRCVCVDPAGISFMCTHTVENAWPAQVRPCLYEQLRGKPPVTSPLFTAFAWLSGNSGTEHTCGCTV